MSVPKCPPIKASAATFFSEGITTHTPPIDVANLIFRDYPGLASDRYESPGEYRPLHDFHFAKIVLPRPEKSTKAKASPKRPPTPRSPLEKLKNHLSWDEYRIKFESEFLSLKDAISSLNKILEANIEDFIAHKCICPHYLNNIDR